MIETPYDPTIERHFKGHDNDIASLCFHPETTQLVSGSLDKTIILWNLKESVRAYRFLGHRDAINDVTFAPSGEVIATASRDRSVRIWVPKVTGQCLDFKAHLGAVRSVQFSPDGEKLLTASDDKSIKLWTVCQRRFIMSLVGHTSWVRCARFSSDGRLIVSCSDDKTIKLWDVTSKRCIKTFHDGKAHNTYVEFHPSGSVIGSANMAGCVKLYDLRTTSLYQHYATHNGPVNMVKFHPKGNFMLTASNDSTMKLLDLLEGRPIYTLKGHANGTSVTSITFSANGEFFASGGADCQLLMWKTNFDKDNVACNIPRKLDSCTKESKFSVEDEKLHTVRDMCEGETEEDDELLHNKFHDMNLQNSRSNSKVSDSGQWKRNIEQKVINAKTKRPFETDHVNVPEKGFPAHSNNVVDALNAQVQSLCNAVTVLEQRLTVLEEELRK